MDDRHELEAAKAALKQKITRRFSADQLSAEMLERASDSELLEKSPPRGAMPHLAILNEE